VIRRPITGISVGLDTLRSLDISVGLDTLGR
jgi:hypothetical protein